MPVVVLASFILCCNVPVDALLFYRHRPLTILPCGKSSLLLLPNNIDNNFQ